MMRLFLAVGLGVVGCARAGGGVGVGDDTPGQPDGNSTVDGSIPIDAREIDAPPPIDAAQTATLLQTANTNQAAIPSPTCLDGNTNESADNRWYRVFSLAEHGIMNRPFYVTSVGYTMRDVIGTVQAQVSIGTYSGAAGSNTLNLAQRTAIAATGLTTLPTTTTGIAITANIAATIPANSQLIVEIYVPDLRGRLARGRIAVTDSTENHFAWTSSAACGTVPPVNVGTIDSAFINSHAIISVTGHY